MTISIHPVNNKRELRKMLLFPWTLYRKDPYWVPPLIPSQLDRFDPQKNPLLASGQFAAYTAKKDGEIVGTIAVSIDAKRNADWAEDRAIFGFFECIDDYQVAQMLFSTAVEWAQAHGKKSLWGPWYFDYEDAHGFLIGEREHKPALMCAHNQAYYPQFAEEFGFQKARRDSLAFIAEVDRPITEIIPEKLSRVAQKVAQHTQITVRHPDLSHFDQELLLVTEVLNKGLAVLDERGFWDIDRMMAHAKSLKPILDPDLIVVAEVDHKAVGWVLGLPDLNEAITYAGGMRYFWQAPLLFAALKRRPKGASMKSIAVDPDYWNRGVDALLIFEFVKNLLANGYTWLDMSLTGEDNPMTPRLATNLGAREYKRYRIYEISW